MHVGYALLTLFPGRVGGSETYARSLLSEYAAGAGPERVTVLANRHVMAAYGELERGPVRLHLVRSYRPGDGNATRLLAMAGAAALPRRAARDVPAGLDVVHYPVTVPIPATGARRVLALHDVQHHDLPDLFPASERAYRRYAYDRAARGADLVVTFSDHAKGRIVHVLGLDPGRIEVVRHGIDHDLFTPGDADAEGRLPAGLPPRFALYPANLWPHKNHERLLEALPLLADREVALVLTGQEYGRLAALLESAGRLGVRDRVHHLGHVPHDALPALYRAADALVFPSLYEGFGAPPLEAMACGCPVAASNRASLPEVCGDAALLFDPESPESIAAALDRVLGEEETRSRLRADGLSWAANFTWRASAERHQAIYARVAAT
jgi:glycosyltransferase involved in cell wall biosynthesis